MCKKGVRTNSVLCRSCQKCADKRCSDVTVREFCMEQPRHSVAQVVQQLPTFGLSQSAWAADLPPYFSSFITELQALLIPIVTFHEGWKAESFWVVGWLYVKMVYLPADSHSFRY